MLLTIIHVFLFINIYTVNVSGVIECIRQNKRARLSDYKRKPSYCLSNGLSASRWCYFKSNSIFHSSLHHYLLIISSPFLLFSFPLLSTPIPPSPHLSSVLLYSSIFLSLSSSPSFPSFTFSHSSFPSSPSLTLPLLASPLLSPPPPLLLLPLHLVVIVVVRWWCGVLRLLPRALHARRHGPHSCLPRCLLDHRTLPGPRGPLLLGLGHAASAAPVEVVHLGEKEREGEAVELN